MKIFVPIALAAFAFFQAVPPVQTTAGPLSREHWQRTLLPPAGAPGGSRCVVLDADLFAHAAAGLRDVRLLQGTRELQYAVDESHDDRETSNGLPPVDDRSIFDSVGTAPFGEGGGVAQAGFQEPPAGGFRVAWFMLPAHVPVERITLLGSAEGPLPVQITAAPRPNAPLGVGGRGMEPEVIRLNAVAGTQSLPVTLGANLQNDAAVTVVIGLAPGVSGVAFEMRRRELCYKPVTDEPVHIVYGDPEAKSIRYDYALQYKPTATPVLATMGPREMNPAYAPPVVEQAFALTLKEKLGIAIGLCVGMLVVTLGVLFRFR